MIEGNFHFISAFWKGESAIIKIDNEQSKVHKINYTDLIKKYKTNIDIKPMEYIISEIKYNLTQLFQIYIIQRYNNIAQTN